MQEHAKNINYLEPWLHCANKWRVAYLGFRIRTRLRNWLLCFPTLPHEGAKSSRYHELSNLSAHLQLALEIGWWIKDWINNGCFKLYGCIIRYLGNPFIRTINSSQDSRRRGVWHIISYTSRITALDHFVCVDGEGHGCAEDSGGPLDLMELRKGYDVVILRVPIDRYIS